MSAAEDGVSAGAAEIELTFASAAIELEFYPKKGKEKTPTKTNVPRDQRIMISPVLQEAGLFLVREFRPAELLVLLVEVVCFVGVGFVGAGFVGAGFE